MRKIVSLLLTTIMVFGFASCEGGKSVPECGQPTPEEGQTDTVGVKTIQIDRVQVQPMGTMVAYMLYEDANERVFVFPLILEEGQEDAVPGKTYVYPGEMSPTYAYWMLSDYTTHALYTEATFKKMVSGADTWYIDATATDTNGDSWKLRFNQE